MQMGILYKNTDNYKNRIRINQNQKEIKNKNNYY